MEKRIVRSLGRIGILSCISMLFAVLPVAAATISVESAIVQKGAAFSLDVSTTGIADLYAFQFDLIFDPMLVAATSVQQGSLLSGSGGFFPGFIDNVVGNVTIVADTLSGPVSGVSGSGTFARVEFNALSAGVTQVSLSNVIVLDSGLADIVTVVDDGALTITDSSTPVPEPTTLGLFVVGMLGCYCYKRSRASCYER